MRQQALKFHHVALVHLDTVLPVKDIESGSVPFLGSLEPISKIFDVRASWQCPEDCALSGPACGDHAHSERNTSEIFSSQHDGGGRSVQPSLM